MNFRSAIKGEFPKAAIHAIEPSFQAFSELKARTANDLKIKPYHQALGERDGSATLHENASDVTNSLLPSSRHISRFAPPEMCIPGNKVTVPLMRIDTLKIDAQGYERHILDGAGSLLSPATIRGLFLDVLFIDLYERQTWCGEVLELLCAPAVTASSVSRE